eukprot:1157526-Pelagomonas_calceolata.AAC.10
MDPESNFKREVSLCRPDVLTLIVTWDVRQGEWVWEQDSRRCVLLVGLICDNKAAAAMRRAHCIMQPRK